MSLPDPAGFDRPMAEPLRHTVKFYQRHLFICTGTSGWPSHIEQDGGFAQALSEAITERASAMPLVVKLNACDEPGRGAAGTFDLLVFPDMVRYLGLTEADIPALVEEHLMREGAAAGLPHKPLMGRHVFICSHGNRDVRCGICGPALTKLWCAEVERRKLTGQVYVHQTSHVGGHQYAGNVLIYPEGDWYGYVTPAAVPRLIEEHILGGQIVRELWRGRMGELQAA
jgi:(2Fe-2S) ferredoxin